MLLRGQNAILLKQIAKIIYYIHTKLKKIYIYIWGGSPTIAMSLFEIQHQKNVTHLNQCNT